TNSTTLSGGSAGTASTVGIMGSTVSISRTVASWSTASAGSGGLGLSAGNPFGSSTFANKSIIGSSVTLSATTSGASSVSVSGNIGLAGGSLLTSLAGLPADVDYMAAKSTI